MAELTKEWLQKTIAELEEERDAVPGVVNEDAAMALAAMKLALASLEAEPVCVIDQSNLDYLKSGSDADVWPASRTEMGDVLLYSSAPPAPVSVKIPPEKPHTDGPLADGWNACRAAMLQGAEPVTTAYKLPEGYVLVPVEPTAEMISSGIAAHYERSQIQIHDRPAPGPMECAYVAMLAAAPQQEVRGE